MDAQTVIWIVIVVLVFAALAWLLRRNSTDDPRRHEAATGREHEIEQAHHAGRRDVLADEAAVQAQAEAKAAVVARLQHGAAKRREYAVSAREANQEFARADDIDPGPQPDRDREGFGAFGAAQSSTRPSNRNDRAPANRQRTTDRQNP